MQPGNCTTWKASYSAPKEFGERHLARPVLRGATKKAVAAESEVEKVTGAGAPLGATGSDELSGDAEEPNASRVH